MSDPSDELDCGEIRARLAEVAPEPWTALGSGVRNGDHWYVVADGHAILSIASNDGSNEDQRQPLAEFVAHAPADIRMLLAEVDRMAWELDPRVASMPETPTRTGGNRPDGAVTRQHPKLTALDMTDYGDVISVRGFRRYALRHIVLGIRYRYPLCCVARFVIESVLRPNAAQAVERGVVYRPERDSMYVPCGVFHHPSPEATM